MFVIVSYDSVFEAEIDEDEEKSLLSLLSRVKLGQNDSIRLYRLCRSCAQKVTLWGKGEVTEDKPYYIA